MPVPVQNLVDGPTTFADPSKNIAMEWQAKDHEYGEDIQIVPDDVYSSAPFQKAIRNGIFARTDQDESEDDHGAVAREAFARQRLANEQKQADFAANAQATITQEPKNDLVQVECIGPNERGNGLCGNPTPIRESQKGEIPPLCSKHRTLASEFIPTETDQFEPDGRTPVVTWQRMSLGPRNV